MAEPFQIFLKKEEGGKSTAITFSKPKEELFVKDLKKGIEDKLGIPYSEQLLIFIGKPLRDEISLSEYMMRTGSCVVLVIKGRGGAMNWIDSSSFRKERSLPQSLPQSNEECVICGDKPTLVMPCKSAQHFYMCSGCVMQYAWEESTTRKQSKICCSLCGSEWGLNVIQKYGQATDEEIGILEETLSVTFVRNDDSIGHCPGCNTFYTRMDTTKSRIRCRTCSNNGKKNPDFCWHCLHPWTSSTTDCGNSECRAAGLLAQIQAAPMTEVIGVSCPSMRLCPAPNCGIGIQHDSGCKHMTCPKCKIKFCFICLRIQTDGNWACGSYNTKCMPAPKQTTVPK